MDFESPLTFESEPSFSVVAEDLGERDITLNNVGTPQPVLASTAQKDRSNTDLMQRIQNHSKMAGSYMEVENFEENDRNTCQNFQFLDFLQKNSSISPSFKPPSSNASSCGVRSNQTNDYSLGILDLEGMRDADESASLVHVDSNASMGSWLADFLPEQARGKASLYKQDDTGSEGNETIDPSSEKRVHAEYSRLASRFLLSESQLPSSDQDSTAQGIPTYYSSVENSLQETPQKSNRLDLDESYMREKSQHSTLTEEEPYEQYSDHEEQGEKACVMLNFSGVEFQDVYSLQQKIFSSEDFAGNIQEVLDKDEEVFIEENKLLMDSGEEVNDVTEIGFSLMSDSPYTDPKLSIGAYMAARSEKMGRLGQESFGMERPSFGLKIRTPSPRKPHPLLTKDVQETYIVEENENEIKDSNTVTEDSRSSSCIDTSHSSTHIEDKNSEKPMISSDSESCDINDNDVSQDVTIDPSMLSLSEAIMNMSTNVNNEELAKAIIEISRKKKHDRMKKNEDQKILKENSKKNLKAGRNSGIVMRNEENSSSKRTSKIPSSKSTSPRKSVRMSYSKKQQNPAERKSLSQRQQPPTIERGKAREQKRESVNASSQKFNPRSSGTSSENDNAGAKQTSGIGTKKAPFEKPVRKALRQEKSEQLNSIEHATEQQVEGRKENEANKENMHRDNCKDVSSSNVLKNIAGKNAQETSHYTAQTFCGGNGYGGVKKKNAILLESFMEDTPVHDGDVIGSPKVIANEELPTFNNGRESVCFPDECNTKYLLSSTRSDLSLTRGSLSRESIEELHKKLRVRGPRVPEKEISSDLPEPAHTQMPCTSEIDRMETDDGNSAAASKRILEEDKTWKTDDADGRQSLHPLSQSSPDRQYSRFSGEFYQMLPSMSFAEMATIQEHDFNPKDLEDDNVCRKNVGKLDVIQEVAETTQDTTISNQSTASGDSQVVPSEITHDQNLTQQTQHSLSHVPSMMHHPQHLYPPMQHLMYRHPSSYPPDMPYRSMEGPYHMPVMAQDYMGRGHTHMYPNHYSYMSNYSHHPMMHSTTSIGYPVEQSSMASSADVALNHTTGTVYPHSSFAHPGMVSGPRAASVDGRFHSFPETYFHHSQRPQSVMETSITVPSELLFTGVRCVSLLSHAKLPLVNKTDRWLQVQMNIMSPSFDCCFSVDSKPLIGPHETKNIDVSFAAKTEGQFEAVVEVISYPVTSEGTMLQGARSAPSMITIKATAEIAKAELRGPDNKHELDFKETICESSKYLPLRLVNKGSAEVPVCVVLCSKSQDRQCFALAESSAFEWSDDEKKSRTVMRKVLPSNDRDATIWVHCRIPAKHCNAAEPPKNISAQIYMEVDNTYQKHSLDNAPLDCLPVEVTACVAKLHAPKNMQPLTFLCPKEDCQVHSLPVKNCGNVQSRVSFSIAEHNDILAVSPSHAALAAGEHVTLSVKFQPGRSTPSRLDATLIMSIEPNATKYEVLIVAESTEARTDLRHSMSSRTLSSRNLENETVPSLLTNKSHLCWGGVAVGKSVQQRLVLRTSPGATKPLPMRVMIKGDDSSCFLILHEEDKEELCSKLEMSMRPGQDKVIRILFAPTKCKMILAKLEIKAPFDQVPSTKFTIPLSGYGGRCEMKIELERLQNDGESTVDQYAAYFNNHTSLATTDPQRRQVPKLRFAVKNSSHRDAFVKAVVYSDKECISQMKDGILACNPLQFVLPKRSSRAVTLILQKDMLSSSERSGYSRNGRDFIGCVCMWYGEEIARCLLKSSLAKLGPSAIGKTLSDCNPLRNVSFDGIFESEGSKPEEDVSQVKPQLGDVQTFFAGMQKTVVHVFGPINEKPLFHKVDGGKMLASASVLRQPNPVKDVQKNDAHHQFHFSSKIESANDSWEVSPEHVMLAAPRTNSTNLPSKIKILNPSNSILRFDVAWSAHYLTITPHSGVVDPESVLIILISPNPSLASRRDLLPWLGTVQISSKDGSSPKQVRVQIRDDVGNLDGSIQPASPRLPLKAQYSEIPSSDSFATPLSSSGRTSSSARVDSSQQILLNSTVVDLGQASVKSTSKSHLDFTNICSKNIRWLLTSFAPAYVKDNEPTGNLYRSSYAAFVFSHTSGLLEPGAKVRIPVSFNPMSEGNYSQFWDLEHHEATDSAAMSLNKVRIQLIGQGLNTSRPSSQASSLGNVNKSKPESGIYVSEDTVKFSDIVVGESTIIKIPVKNRSKNSHSVRFVNVRPPFHITHQRHTIRPMSYACLPVTFKPVSKGDFEGSLVIQTEGTHSLTVKLIGSGV